MEELKKCIAVALNEMGKLKFSGPSVIPAGNVMSALYLAGDEINRLEKEEKARQAEITEEKPQTEEKEEQNGDDN